MSDQTASLAPRFVVETGRKGGYALPRPVAPARAGVRLSCLVAATLLALLNAADVATTHALDRLGGTEVNPVANWLLQRGALGDAKALLVGLIAVLVVLSSRPQRVVRPLWVAVAVYGAVVAGNTAQLLQAGAV